MRTNVESADELIGKYFSVLDGTGFIGLTDYLGSDQAIEQAARTSYSKGTRKVSDTRGLLRRLMRDKHTSPFEFAELQFHVKAPMYVVQQWLRHRTSNFCAQSHRFSEVKTDYQVTEPNAWRLQDQNNKQGSDGFLAEEEGLELTNDEFVIHQQLREVYEKRINKGVAREQARKESPMATYTEFVFKTDLHNLLNFIRLRTAPDAQLEIRVFADIIAGIVKRIFPLIWEAFVDYNFCARTFSRMELDFLSSLIYNYDSGSWVGKREDFENESAEKLGRSGLSKREYEEFWKKLEPPKIPSFELDLSTAKTIEQMESHE